MAEGARGGPAERNFEFGNYAPMYAWAHTNADQYAMHARPSAYAAAVLFGFPQRWKPHLLYAADRSLKLLCCGFRRQLGERFYNHLTQRAAVTRVPNGGSTQPLVLRFVDH